MLSSAMVRGRKYGEMALKKIDSEYALVTISISRFHLHEIHMFFFFLPWANNEIYHCLILSSDSNSHG